MAATLISPLSGTAPSTLADSLLEQIRKAVVEGEIAPGAKISEPELARRFGVSRGPLREAISRLEAGGLVTRRPNVGARVITLSAQGLIEIYELREALEGMAARLAAENMSDEEVQAMRDLLEIHQANVEEKDGQAYFQKEGDLDFHYRIIQGSRNQRLTRVLCDDLYHLARMYRFQFGMASRRARKALEEHGMILDAIADRDGESAELLMRRHIRASRRNVERLLNEGDA